MLDGKQTGPLGDTINVAARLQSLAQTGQVLVGPETRRAIEDTFDLEDLGLHDLKGKGEPVAVARVVSIAARNVTPARRSGPLRRPRQRAEPAARRVRAGAQGHARVRRNLRRRPAPARRASSRSSARASPPTRRGSRAARTPSRRTSPTTRSRTSSATASASTKTDSAETVREKLEQRVGALVENPSEILPPLLQLYDIEGSQGSSIDREAYRERLQESVRDARAGARRARAAGRLPAGPPLGGPIDRRPPAPAGERTSRLDADARTTTARSSRSTRAASARSSLEELSDRDTRDLVESLLDASDVPDELVTFLDERTGGNPFFMEEIVNSLHREPRPHRATAAAGR